MCSLCSQRHGRPEQLVLAYQLPRFPRHIRGQQSCRSGVRARSQQGRRGKLRETIVKARKYVVLSSGTLGTPQILERSGVGDAKLLKKLDLKVVSDLPGVGYVSVFFLVHMSPTSCELQRSVSGSLYHSDM